MKEGLLGGKCPEKNRTRSEDGLWVVCSCPTKTRNGAFTWKSPFQKQKVSHSAKKGCWGGALKGRDFGLR